MRRRADAEKSPNSYLQLTVKLFRNEGRTRFFSERLMNAQDFDFCDNLSRIQ